MLKVLGVDHLSIAVSDFRKSMRFYDRHLKFLGFKVLDEYEDAIGWTNGITRLWITAADSRARKHREGNVGFDHYAFRLVNRRAVDSLQAFLKKARIKIVDPAGEYYPEYYAVYFLDPDGMRLEGMWAGP